MYGVCRLTGTRGTFVKSHIIPRALTQFGPANEPTIMINSDKDRPFRRRDGWYDKHLVNRQGEDIREEFDSWAIATLRRCHLIWSSWGSRVEVPPPHDQNPYFGIRMFEDIDPVRLRLFFASLLWRAAASTLVEFGEITLPPADLETLRQSLVSRAPLGDKFYPVSLTQLSTRGPDHIRAPFKTDMNIYDDDGNPLGTTPIFRFYFDGLAAQFWIRAPQPLGVSGVGNEANLSVFTRPFEGSRQRMDGQANMAAARASWPRDMKRLRLDEGPTW